jgi:sulfatase maturation enzyme AslB (radical SAM superfamily)
MAKQNRPQGYDYFGILKNHLRDLGKIFAGQLTYPRQMEIHLPADHKKACNFNCSFCAGKLFKKDLGHWEMTALKLLHNLKGAIPFNVFGGAYTEPLLNPYYLTFLATTKELGSHFGIHSNGSLLKLLEENQGWLTELCRLATDRQDYLSVSLDAGQAKSHSLTKGLNQKSYFDDIIEGVALAVKIRHKTKAKGPTIRLCYLMVPGNSSPSEIKKIVGIAKKIKVDSLRFSIPFASYNQQFDKVRKYRDQVERKLENKFCDLVKPYLTSTKQKPHIFHVSSVFQDIDVYDFSQCIYGYYQVTLGADGYVYRCSTTSTPSFPQFRLGKITSDVKKFNQMILADQNPRFKASTCFAAGARCNRQATECNRTYRDLKESGKI